MLGVTSKKGGNNFKEWERHRKKKIPDQDLTRAIIQTPKGMMMATGPSLSLVLPLSPSLCLCDSDSQELLLNFNAWKRYTRVYLTIDVYSDIPDHSIIK